MTVPIRTGLAAQLGLVEETVYGTFVAPARWFEFVSESFAMEIERLESAGIRGGTRVLPSSRWASGQKTVTGDVELETTTTNLGILFEHAFGGVATVNDLATAYTHTFTPDDLPVGGLAVQVGRPDTSAAGTVHPFSYLGGRIASWSLEGAVGEIGKLGVSFLFQDEDTSEALGTPSYPANELLVFTQATLEIAAAAVDVRAVTFNGDNGLVADRFKLGSDLAEEPLEGSPMRTYDGTIDAHFDTLAAYTRFVAGAEAVLEFKFEGAEIETAHNFSIIVNANVRFDGETPTVGGPDELVQNLPFKVVDEAQLDLVYKTTDVTP